MRMHGKFHGNRIHETNKTNGLYTFLCQEGRLQSAKIIVKVMVKAASYLSSDFSHHFYSHDWIIDLAID